MATPGTLLTSTHTFKYHRFYFIINLTNLSLIGKADWIIDKLMVIIGCGAFDRGFTILSSKVSTFLIDANPVNPILFDLYIYLTNFRIQICFNPAQRLHPCALTSWISNEISGNCKDTRIWIFKWFPIIFKIWICISISQYCHWQKHPDKETIPMQQ